MLIVCLALMALIVGVKAEATLKVGVFSDKVKYGNPKGMDEFMAAFGLAHETFLY